MRNNIEKSLNTAFASAKMEGFHITPKVEADCRMIVNGELSIHDYLKQVIDSNPQGKRSNENVVQP